MRVGDDEVLVAKSSLPGTELDGEDFPDIVRTHG
jgi:hypothetical protein